MISDYKNYDFNLYIVHFVIHEFLACKVFREQHEACLYDWLNQRIN